MYQDQTERQPKPAKFIQSGNEQQYRYFIRKRNISKREYPRLINADQLRGKQACEITRIGTWHELPLSASDEMETAITASKSTISYEDI